MTAPRYRAQFDNARDPYAARNALDVVNWKFLDNGGGKVQLPAGDITFKAGSGTTLAVTNQTVTIAAAGGGGNVSNSGTPTSGQYARWTDATHIQGVAPATVLTDIGAQQSDATLTALAAYNTNGLLTQTAADTFAGRTLTGPAAGITVSNGNGVGGNPTLALANDLAALEGASGTNTIYYRSAIDTWSAVTIGTGLSFSSGTLTAAAPGLVLLNTVTAANSAYLIDTTSFTGTYDSYEIELVNLIPVSSAVQALMQVQISGAFITSATYNVSAGGPYGSGFGTGAQFAADLAASSTGFYLSGSGTNLNAVTNNANYGLCGIVRLHGINRADNKYLSGQVSYYSGPVIAATLAGVLPNSGAITGVRIYFSAGNVNTGLIRIYGRKT